MASNRHLGRIIALQALFEYDFRRKGDDKNVDIREILARNMESYRNKVQDRAFVDKLVDGVIANAAELDQFIAPLAASWPLSQIALIDHEILRMAVYELQNFDFVPRKVAINEAVELAKAFGSENSSRFINGVLGSAMRQIEAEEKNEQSKQPEE